MEAEHNPTEYHKLEAEVTKELSEMKRFASMEERQDSGVLPLDIISTLCHGNPNILGVWLKFQTFFSGRNGISASNENACIAPVFYADVLRATSCSRHAFLP